MRCLCQCSANAVPMLCLRYIAGNSFSSSLFWQNFQSKPTTDYHFIHIYEKGSQHKNSRNAVEFSSPYSPYWRPHTRATLPEPIHCISASFFLPDLCCSSLNSMVKLWFQCSLSTSHASEEKSIENTLKNQFECKHWLNVRSRAHAIPVHPYTNKH